MANSYCTFIADQEQNLVYDLDFFLTNAAGWYKIHEFSATGTDRDYVFLSEGEEDDGRAVRIIRIRGYNNDVIIYGYLYGDYDFSTNTFSSELTETVEYRDGPDKVVAIADKDRVIFLCEGTSTTYIELGYVGFINSFYDPNTDPSPIMVRGMANNTIDFSETTNDMMLFTPDGVANDYSIFAEISCTVEGWPNPRNGAGTFYNYLVYFDNWAGNYEIRGRVRGVFYAPQRHLARNSFVQIGNDYYYAWKTVNESDTTIYGPVSENGVLPVEIRDQGFPRIPYMKPDYTYVGLTKETGSTGTLALWRFDTGHLDNYRYGFSYILPVPGTYIDEMGTYNLTPQNGMTSVYSRLRQAAEFDGSGDYATCAGSATVSGALNADWTFECVFMPAAIPTGTDVDTLIHYGSTSDGNESENDLLRVSLVAASGTTPDEFNVERGNLDIRWEYGTTNSVRLCSDSDFVQQDRWNYLAIRKAVAGETCTVSVYHCSFGDHCVPQLKNTFTGVNNSSGGDSSSWYVGTDAAQSAYFAGLLDDTRITKRVLTEEEIEISCGRAML